MRKTLLLNLYICTLSILCQSPSCLAQTENPSVRSFNGHASIKDERAVELKQNEARISDETNHKIQRRQVIDNRTRDNVHQLRRKREPRDGANPLQLRGSSNPSNRAGLTSGEQRFKKSNRPVDRSSVRLINMKHNAKINSAKEMGTQGDQTNQDKRDLLKQRGAASRSSMYDNENQAKSEQKEAKRSSYSSETARVMKPKSRAIEANDSTSQPSFSKSKLTSDDRGTNATFRDDAKAQKLESDNKQVDDEADLDEDSAEYEEADEEDDTENNQEISQAGKKSEERNAAQSAEDDDDFGSQEIDKRGTDAAEDEYENVEDQDGICEEVNVVDDSIHRDAKIQSEAGLLEKEGKEESRVKRHDTEASDNVFENNATPKISEEHLEDAKEDSEDDSKREISQGLPATSAPPSLQTQGEDSKRQASENLNKDEANAQGESQLKNGDDELNESPKPEAGLQRENQTDSKNQNNTSGRSDSGLNKEMKRSEDVETDVNVATETISDLGGNGKSSKQESNFDVTGTVNELNSDYEKTLEQQIQQRIDSIKEEIKREVEEKQKIQEIEENNAKYDDMQNQIDEDEDEDIQSLDIPSERKAISKRSIIDGIRNPQVKRKRRILRRVKRSGTTDARQLRAIEGVEKLDPDVLVKAQLRHESIRKRSAPIYGAADQDLPDISKSSIEKDSNPRLVSLVNNEQRRSPIPKGREGRNTIIIPEHAHVNIEDELPPGLSLDPSLLKDSSSQASNRLKRSPEQFTRRRRASAVIPDGRVAFLGYRPQDDDENDEGSEFDDDGFEDRTSNLQQDKSYAVPHDQYQIDESGVDKPANFLFTGADNFLVRRKRSGMKDDDQSARLHGGGALTRRQTQARAKQMQTTKISSKQNLMERDKRQTQNAIHHGKAGSVASLVESSQELSPRLATEYREAFGGLQSEPGGAFARFKRVKRSALHRSLV